MSSLKEDLFILPHQDKYIVYSPLRSAVFSANNAAKIIIEKYIADKELSEEEKRTKVYNYIHQLEEINVAGSNRNQSKNKFSHLTIIPTQMCNLSCSYCFAKESRSNDVLDKEKLKVVIDYVFDNDQIMSHNKRFFSFIGGGEPLLCWNLFVWTVEYIENKAKEKSLSINISVVTNTTLLDDERAFFLKDHNIKVTISFDIIPEVQNEQRSFANKNNDSFEIVNRNIKKYMSYGIFTRIRSTITDLNVDLMPQMVSFVKENYPNINRLAFEPVNEDCKVSDNFYNKFIDKYFVAKNYGQNNNIKITNSIDDSLSDIKNSFCPVQLCITPTGDIVSCHRVSSDKDTNFELFHYGNVNKNVNISEEDFNKVIKTNHTKQKECASCFAKWHCAGGCSASRVLLSKKQQEAYCSFVVLFLKKILAERFLKKEVNL